MTSNVLEFFVKMKDMMSGGLAKLSSNSSTEFGKIQDNIEKTSRKNKELQDSFDAVGKKAKSSLGGIGDIIKGTLGADAIKGLLQSGFEVVKGSISKAMDFGKIKESFKVLTGNDGIGLNLANDLNQLQQMTILGPEVFKSAQTMLSFGAPADAVVSTLKRLGDVSMGDAQKLESLTLAYSQIQSAGKLQGQDLLQLINAGWNPLNEIHKKTGISMADLKKQMEKGAISADMVTQALIASTSQGGLFNNMMNKLADTPAGKMAQMEGQWESLQVKFGETLMPLAMAVMSLLGPLMDIASTWMPYISEGISTVMSYFNSLNDSSSNWSYYLQSIGEIIGVVWQYAQAVFGVFWAATKPLIAWIGHSQLLRDIFTGIKFVITSVFTVLTWVADKLKALYENTIGPILDGIEKVYGWLKGLVGGKTEVTVNKTDTGATLTASMPTASNSSSLTATQAVSQSAGKMAMPSASKSEKGDIAKGITQGGPRVINITIGKMVERIEVRVANMQEGVNNIESQVEEAFLRILNSGAIVQ